jgi:acetylornithine deacetylase/succinyl-diaminopimelate desuccinylase-like protein
MIEKIYKKTRTEEFKKYVTDLLVEICKIDTSPFADVNIMKEAESKCFEIIERELNKLEIKNREIERKPIDPSIKDDPDFSLLHFTKTDEKPEGLSAEETYKNRVNLLHIIKGTGDGEGNNVALNSHIDVVDPYFPPSVKDGVVYGRGSCDDKGPTIAQLAALKILSELVNENNLEFKKNIVSMYVVEEETGGNGSLSLANDKELKKLYDSIMVLECCDNNIHPANRGAVWYRADLTLDGANLFELSAFVNEEMEKEGRAIKAESRHDLFPQRPVQTCHGMIGEFGEHPSRICGEVEFIISFDKEIDQKTETILRDCIDYAVEEYIGRYGDKTKAIDPQTNKPKVDHHFDIKNDGTKLIVSVHGSTGHMGSIMENDGAITKMSYMVRSLCYSRIRINDTAGSEMKLELANHKDKSFLKLEGGQGFVPTHQIEEVMGRFADSAKRGAETYARFMGLSAKGEDIVKVTYDKLHNAAFDGDPESPEMLNAIAAAKECGMWKEQEVMGWTVSCDSRIFARKYPGMPVITTGAGKLVHAHGDGEQLEIDALIKSIEFTAIYLMKQTGIA